MVELLCTNISYQWREISYFCCLFRTLRAAEAPETKLNPHRQDPPPQRTPYLVDGTD